MILIKINCLWKTHVFLTVHLAGTNVMRHNCCYCEICFTFYDKSQNQEWKLIKEWFYFQTFIANCYLKTYEVIVKFD